MDFHKLENDTIKLKVSKIDIISFLQQLVDVYRTNAKEKGIPKHIRAGGFFICMGG
jgi:hypothetical protein